MRPSHMNCECCGAPCKVDEHCYGVICAECSNAGRKFHDLERIDDPN